MLGIHRLPWALALATTIAVGCGGGDDTMASGGSSGTGGQGGATTSSSSSSSSSSGAGGGDAGPSCPTMEGTVLAVKQLYFGTGNSGEWKKFGFDIDGKVSDSLSTDLCQPSSGGMPKNAYPDGEQGIDNSFGKNLLPTILALYPTWESDINAAILNGEFTGLFKIECLPPTGDAPVLTTKLFGGTSLGSAPKWNGLDTWPVEPELLSDPKDPLSSTIIFDKSSVLGTTYDSGKDVTFVLTVPIHTQTDSTSLKLTLHDAHLTMNLSDDRKSATSGMIGGVLNTEEFVAEVKKVGALMKLCSNSLFTELLTQVRQASDILTDGTQDPTKTCDGISIGLGFDMQEAQIGDVGPAASIGMSCQ